MRDLLLAGLMLWLVLASFRYPWVGVLGWTWVSVMNPHALSWALKTMPVAAAVGGATLLGLLLQQQQRKNFFLCRENAVLMLFMLWMCITLPFSIFLDASLPMWDRVMKIDLMILVSMVLLYSRRHTILLVWVLVGSIAFYGVKGGLFTIATGGNYRVWGPENTFIEGNNEMALALIMVIPLMRFLQQTLSGRWARHAMTASMLLCAAAALGSHSRGALLAIAAMALVMWWRGKNKLMGALVMVLISVAVLSLMSDEWWERMNTIRSYQEDASANGRINAWWMAFNLAKDRFFGGGYYIWTGAVFAVYAPVPDDPHAAHSIYFQVLGEQGFVGLFLFLLMWLFVWQSANYLRREGPKQPQTRWLADLGSMCQVSLAGYAVGGAFLSLSYYDLPYYIMVVVVIGRRWIERKEWLNEKEEALVNWPAFLRPARKRIKGAGA